MKNRNIYIVFFVASIFISLTVYFVYSFDNDFLSDSYYTLAQKAVDSKIQHPFSRVVIDTTKQINGLDLHYTNAEYRLFLPMLGNIMKLDSSQLTRIKFYLLPFFLFCFLIFLYRQTQNTLLSVLLAATFISSYVCLCFTHEFLFFDAYALLMMSFILLCKNKYLFFVLLFMSFWMDERMLLSSGLIILLKIFLETGMITFKSVFAYIFRNKVFLFAWIIYFLFRIIVTMKCNFYGIPSIYLFFTKTAIFNNVRGGVLSFVYTYKAWCAIIFFNLYIAIKTEKIELYSILFLIILIIVSCCIVVYDFSRIQLYFLPFILLNIFYFLSHIKNKNIQTKAVLVIFLINLVMPSKLIYGGLKNKIQNIHTLWYK